MFSNEDYERLYIRYKGEAVPRGESIQSFCSRNKVPYNLFDKWYRDTRHRVVPVQVEGRPVAVEEPEVQEVENQEAKLIVSQKPLKEPVRIMIDVRMTNGMHIQQKNLSYLDLQRLVEKLEVLC